MICILRSTPSAEARPYLGAVLVRGPAGSCHTALNALSAQVPCVIAVRASDAAPCHLPGIAVVDAAARSTETAALVLAALNWTLVHARMTPWVATVPGDFSAVPSDLVARFGLAVSGAKAELAFGVVHGAVLDGLGLWPTHLGRQLAALVSRDPGASALKAATGRRVGTVVVAPSTR